jgi:hypothetical protein
MEIIYFGASSFRLKGKYVSVLINPTEKTDSDIATFSNSSLPVKTGDNTFIIQYPGEYEIKGASVLGLRTSGANSCFLYEIDGMRLFHLGEIKEKLAENQLNEIGEVDILFIPVGGGETLNPKQALEIAAQIEPKIIIPMSYQSVDEFLKEEGDGAETLPKLVISRLDLPIETKTVVLERKSG